MNSSINFIVEIHCTWRHPSAMWSLFPTFYYSENVKGRFRSIPSISNPPFKPKTVPIFPSDTQGFSNELLLSLLLSLRFFNYLRKGLIFGIFPKILRKWQKVTRNIFWKFDNSWSLILSWYILAFPYHISPCETTCHRWLGYKIQYSIIWYTLTHEKLWSEP